MTLFETRLAVDCHVAVLNLRYDVEQLLREISDCAAVGIYGAGTLIGRQIFDADIAVPLRVCVFITYVCIEPWVSLPSEQGKAAAFEEQPDLIALEPGGQYQNHWSITVST